MTADTLTGGKLSDAARQVLERYVRELRFLLQACPTIDPAEVEAEVRSHIDQELADAPTPVSSERLDAILMRLGSPTQWVPIDELPWWRRVLIRLRMGPSSDRWALGVFFMWVLGLLLVPVYGFGLLLIFASFLFARAVLAMSEESGAQLAWRRWLVYPSLLSLYVPAITFSLGWAALAAGIPFVVTGQRVAKHYEYARIEHPITVLSSGAVGVGVWWIILGIILFLFPRLPHVIFRPFFVRASRKVGVALMCVGAMVALIGLIGLVAWLS